MDDDHCPRCGQRTIGHHVVWKNRARLCENPGCGWVTCRTCRLTIDPVSMRAFDDEGTVTL